MPKNKTTKKTDEKQKMLRLIIGLHKVVNRHGIEATSEHLHNATKKSSLVDRPVVEQHSKNMLIILRVVSEYYSKPNITLAYLKKNNLRGDAIQIRNAMFVICKKCLFLTLTDTAELFHPVSIRTVFGAIKAHNSLDKNNTIDKNKIDAMNELCNKVDEELNLKQKKK